MEFLQRTLASVRKQLGPLSTTHKLLIGSVVIVMLMTLFVVSQYSSKQTYVEFAPGSTPPQTDSNEQNLAGMGIEVKREGGKLLVRSEDKNRAIVALGEAGKLPNDKAILFENILQKQSWTNSRQQNEQLYNSALQNELAARISDFRAIKSAAVFLDIPEVAGFGAQMRKPSASVTVTTDSGAPMDQATVDAVARFVSGSRAGLTIDRISVIDAASGRQRKATSDEDALPTTYLEHASKIEAQTREKVEELLSYIPGVMVAVTAHVDVTRSKSEIRTNMPEKQGTITMRKKETESTTSSSMASKGAEPGFSANQTADINRGGGSPGNKSETNTTTTEYENHIGTRTETVLDPRGHATMVAVSVNVPRGFVASLIKPAADAPATDEKKAPTDEEVLQRFAQVKKEIVDSLTPHVRAMITQASSMLTVDDVKKIVSESIEVAMIPVDVPLIAAGAPGVLSSLGGVWGTSSGGGLLSGGMGALIDKGVLVVLSIAALGMMFTMVKKAAKRTEMPTAEELVGLPPSLESEGDIMGEAAEGEVAMAGIEVDDAQVQIKKVLEQVVQMVEHSPESSSKLLNRWITEEE